MKILYLSILVLCLLAAYPTSAKTIHVTVDIPEAHSYQEAAKILSEQTAGNDTAFVERTKAYVYHRIKYINTTRSEVLNPQAAWAAREGDCSERALLLSAMLKPRVDARVIHGIIPGQGNHATVETHIGHYIRIVDKQELPTFVKLGDGLGAVDKVVNEI